MNSYRTEYEVRFQHCDPAGLVFYPRAFEMINDVITDWFRFITGRSTYELLYEDKAVLPTLKAECEFLSATRVSDKLLFELQVERLGNSSMVVTLGASCNGELRLRARNTLAYVSLQDKGGKPRAIPFPEQLRAKIEAYGPCL